MDQWKRVVTTLQWAEIEEAVKDTKWQAFRKGLKGITTQEKLVRLDAWVKRRLNAEGHLPRMDQVRVDNYINALLRGGQLVRHSGSIHVQR